MARRAGAQRGAARGPGAWTPRELVELAVQHDLAELEVEQGGMRIRVVRERGGAAGEAAPRAVAPAATGALPAERAEPAGEPSLVKVEAPMVGTFYRAPSPDAAPFVTEGDLVKDGQVLCIIEAMKLMNEIESKVAGRIAKVLVENGQPVEFGQPLFLMEPRR
ncbi:MAG: acetyl-CoA carboxylase biotin carboxyl carrier protein [Candidatus Rokubacteria bacterium]|nr:acetyl-CoA carboxylase biotin carboxyl carrier protein [Candidatus Rokubacteria bacterium]